MTYLQKRYEKCKWYVCYENVIIISKLIKHQLKIRICYAQRQKLIVYPVAWLRWWRHQMETFSALLAICAGNSPVPGEFPAQRPVTRSFNAFFDLRLNKRLSKQSLGWWFETLSCPLWRHRNDTILYQTWSMRDWWLIYRRLSGRL